MYSRTVILANMSSLRNLALLLPLVVAQTTTAATTTTTGDTECGDADPHTWWFVVGILVLVFGLVLAFFGGYYVASTVTPSVRYTPEAERVSTTAHYQHSSPTLAAFSKPTSSPSPAQHHAPLARTNAKNVASKLKPVVVSTADDSPLDRYNFALKQNN